MSHDPAGRPRRARADDAAQLLALWDLLFDEMGSAATSAWRHHARDWFATYVDESDRARIAVVEVAGELVASAVGTLEVGVPNPRSPTGRGVRLVNVVTTPAHRGRGHATELVRDVVAWAEGLGTDRVDLSATLEGERLYERLGFTRASAPRMKRML